MKSNNTLTSKTCRVQRPQRNQVEMRFLALDEMLEKDHRARVVWQFVQTIDIQPLYADFKTTSNSEGRSPIAPEVLVALWLLATIDSISSAREVARRTTTDLPYMWICGGVSVNYHTLSDLRSNNADFFEKTLVNTVTAMMHADLVTLDTIAQDGMRVRASAGSSSFRRQPKLEELHQEATEHVKKLREQSEDESKRGKASAASQAAAQRAADERQQRIADSLSQVEELAKKKEKREKGDGKKARCSTTDPDARKMKMGDGGFRPAYNFQFATDGDSRVIVGVEVTNSGSDRGEMAPMYQSVCETYQKTPGKLLVDSAFATKGDVKLVEQSGTEVVSTVPGAASMRKRGKDPFSKQPGESDEFTAFRARMGTEEYQELYKQRPSIAEFPNAECRNRGCRLLRVRGLEKVRSVGMLYALTFNLMRKCQLQGSSMAH